MSDATVAIRVTQRQAPANEASLVLAAANIPSQVVRRPEGFFVEVQAADVERAEAELRAHEAEVRAQHAARVNRPKPRATVSGPTPALAAVAVGLALTAFHALSGPARSGSVWFELGTADAFAIRAGEWWRAATALTLHADAGHLAANLFFGAVLFIALGRAFGVGLCAALVLLSGIGGNLVNALLRASPHLSVGASTAVFGAVGVLAGDAIARRAVRGDSWRAVVAPVAAALGLLAMTGSGEDRVDVYAHLFGIVVGAPIGVAAGLGVAAPPRATVQWLLGLAAAGLVGVAWGAAVGTAPA